MPTPFQPLTRRGFLQSSALLASRPVWPRQDPAAAAEPVRPALPKNHPDVLRVGLVGCGGRGTGAAFQAVSAEQGSVVLTAMADVFPEKIESSVATLVSALGERADRVQVDPDQRFSGFNGWEQLMQTDVDIVLLATPPHFRPVMLAGAVAAGKHVFCEKPVAVDAPGVRNALASAEIARTRGLSLVSGFCWRYSTRHRELYRRVLDGALGEVRAVYSTYLTTPNARVPRQPEWSEMEGHLRNWFHVNWLSGDHVVEQACHSLDKMAWAMGDVPPLSVTAVGGRAAKEGPDSGNNYDHFAATFEYPGEVRGFHFCRQIEGCPFDNSDRLLGTRGIALVDGWAPRHEITGENAWAYEGDDNDMYQQELDELCASIRAGSPRNDGTWMAHSTLLAIMARMAAYTGQIVTWEQAMASQEQLGPAGWEHLTPFEFGDCPLVPPAVPGRTRLY
jgi:predicted dehydrogenase